MLAEQLVLGPRPRQGPGDGRADGEGERAHDQRLAVEEIRSRLLAARVAVAERAARAAARLHGAFAGGDHAVARLGAQALGAVGELLPRPRGPVRHRPTRVLHRAAHGGGAVVGPFPQAGAVVARPRRRMQVARGGVEVRLLVPLWEGRRPGRGREARRGRARDRGRVGGRGRGGRPGRRAGLLVGAAEHHPGEPRAGQRQRDRVLLHRLADGVAHVAAVAAQVAGDLPDHRLGGEAALEFGEGAGELAAIPFDVAFDLVGGAGVSGHGRLRRRPGRRASRSLRCGWGRGSTGSARSGRATWRARRPAP